MKKLATLATVLAVVGTSACATHPNNIQSAYVSPMTYSNYTCEQLQEENNRLGARVDEVTGQQRRRANNDAWAFGVGMVLFWPALFFMANGDQKEELSRLKGEYDAIQTVAVQKNCMKPTQVASNASAS